MAILHVTEAEAARDLPNLLLKVRAGERILIESGSVLIAILAAPEPQPASLSEAIRRSEERGANVTLDHKVGKHLEEIVRMHGGESLIDPWEFS